MGRLLALFGLVLTGLLITASPVIANGGGNSISNGGTFRCNGTHTGVTIPRDVVVPANKGCILVNSTVKGDVEVQANAYLQATRTSIRGSVLGNKAQTVFIDTGSSVGGSVGTDRTAQVFVFDATVNGSIAVARSTDEVYVCGTTVRGMGIGVVGSGPDILVGDPLAVDCAGNTVTRGSVAIMQNRTDSELVVRGNSIPNGNLFVVDNTGSSAKVVQRNTGRKISCTGNKGPFVGAPNPGWQSYTGQCTA